MFYLRLETADVGHLGINKKICIPWVEWCHLPIVFKRNAKFLIGYPSVFLVQCGLILAKCPTNIYLFIVNNRDTRKRCEICSKLTIKTPERRQYGVVFIVNFEHIAYLF